MAEKTTDRTFIVMLRLVMVATRTSAFAGNVPVPTRAASFVVTFGVMPASARMPQSQPVVVVMEEPAECAGGQIGQQKRDRCQTVLSRREHGTRTIPRTPM